MISATLRHRFRRSNAAALLTSALPVLALAALPAPALAKRPTVPDSFELGRDSRGEPCVANRYWGDPAATDHFADSFAITCRGATANRFLGVVRAVHPDEADKVEALLQCGEASDASVAGLGAVRARRCFDSLLGFETVTTTVAGRRALVWGQRHSLGAGPGRRGAAGPRQRDQGQSRPQPHERADGRSRRRFRRVRWRAWSARCRPTAIPRLQQGLRLIRQGLHMEASRSLNDAISRMPRMRPRPNGSSCCSSPGWPIPTCGSSIRRRTISPAPMRCSRPIPTCPAAKCWSASGAAMARSICSTGAISTTPSPRSICWPRARWTRASRCPIRRRSG